MFETAEVGRSVDNATYKKKSLKLREELVQLQDSFRDSAKRQFIVVLAGVDGGGKGETVKLLNQWMDPRWLHTNAYDHEETEHHGRPEFWVYWRDLPPRGRIGMFLSAWYSRPILDHVYERIDDLAFEDALNRIVKFEGALANDNAVVIKFWMHLSREAQEKRLRNLEEDPLTEARVSRHDWHNWRRYERFIDTAERVISERIRAPHRGSSSRGRIQTTAISWSAIRCASTSRSRWRRGKPAARNPSRQESAAAPSLPWDQLRGPCCPTSNLPRRPWTRRPTRSN